MKTAAKGLNWASLEEIEHSWLQTFSKRLLLIMRCQMSLFMRPKSSYQLETEFFFFNSCITTLVPHCSKWQIFFIYLIVAFCFFIFYYSLFINLSFENPIKGHNAAYFGFWFAFYEWIFIVHDCSKHKLSILNYDNLLLLLLIN